MAKVLEYGTFRKKHYVCGSVIEFTYNELKDEYTTDYLGDREEYKALLCPACGMYLKLPSDISPCVQ